MEGDSSWRIICVDCDRIWLGDVIATNKNRAIFKYFDATMSHSGHKIDAEKIIVTSPIDVETTAREPHRRWKMKGK